MMELIVLRLILVQIILLNRMGWANHIIVSNYTTQITINVYMDQEIIVNLKLVQI